MWKEQSELRPGAWFAFQLDATAMTFDDVFDDAQPDACAFCVSARQSSEPSR